GEPDHRGAGHRPGGCSAELRRAVHPGQLLGPLRPGAHQLQPGLPERPSLADWFWTPRRGDRPMRQLFLMAAVALLLLWQGAARATTVGQIEPVARLGDTISGVSIPIDWGYFGIGTLTDRGQLVFD